MTITSIIAICVKITAAINAVRETVDAATDLVISVRKFIDSFGNVSTQIVYQYDSDGDGELDSEQVIYNIESYIPDLNEPYQLVDKNGTIGLGFPKLRTVDSLDVSAAFSDSEYHSSTSGGYRIALEGDDVLDDVVYPLPFDYTGDGLSDFEIIVDDNNNGLPDYCPTAPFYPIGSEGYQEIVEAHSENVPALEKSFKNYNVSEALLFVIACSSLVAIFSKIFKRRKLL